MEGGSVISVRDEHPAKTQEPSFVMVGGSAIEVRDEHPEKTSRGRDVIVVGSTMKLTLACDHRTVDGATGAQFLQTLREYIEQPLRLVI